MKTKNYLKKIKGAIYMTMCPECGAVMKEITKEHWSGNEIWFKCIKCDYEILWDVEV